MINRHQTSVNIMPAKRRRRQGVQWYLMIAFNMSPKLLPMQTRTTLNPLLRRVNFMFKSVTGQQLPQLPQRTNRPLISIFLFRHLTSRQINRHNKTFLNLTGHPNHLLRFRHTTLTGATLRNINRTTKIRHRTSRPQ